MKAEGKWLLLKVGGLLLNRNSKTVYRIDKINTKISYISFDVTRIYAMDGKDIGFRTKATNESEWQIIQEGDFNIHKLNVTDLVWVQDQICPDYTGWASINNIETSYLNTSLPHNCSYTVEGSRQIRFGTGRLYYYPPEVVEIKKDVAEINEVGLIEIALDKQQVDNIRYWLNSNINTRKGLYPISRTTLIADCISNNKCIDLCHKIWPNLKDKERNIGYLAASGCPCINNLNVSGVFKDILRISDAYNSMRYIKDEELKPIPIPVPEKLYKVGDVFASTFNNIKNDLYIIAKYNDGSNIKYHLVCFSGNEHWNTKPMFADSSTDISLKSIVEGSLDKLEYLGNFSELKFANSKVWKIDSDKIIDKQVFPKISSKTSKNQCGDVYYEKER